MRRHLSLVLAVALLAGLLGAGSALAQTPRATPAQGTGTITLSESGWSDPAVGSWDAETRVATLTQDLTKSVLVQADNLTLDGAGHTMTGTGSGDGIYLDGRSGVTIRNLTVRRFARAFVLLASTEITVTASTASNSTYGYYLNNAASLCFLEGNTASDNDYGFYLRTVSEITLEENVASGNRFRGFHVERSSMNELSRNQALSNGQDGIYLQAAHYNTLDSNRSDGNGNYGLRVEACAANTLHANTMSQNRFNLRVDGTAENHYNHAIDESNLVDARAVIYRLDAPNQTINASSNAGTVYLIRCPGSVVRNLTLTNTDLGVLLYKSADSRIENVQASNAGTGIRLYGSPNTSISGCTTSGNDYHGIWADSLSGATLTGNTTRQNRYYGIYLRAVSASTVTTNTIEANAVGLYLEGAQNNQLYANRLTANTTQASVMNGSGNVFSLPAPVGGNYWSNWATPDVNHDGFVDQPYVFFGGRDDLPLAEVGWSDTTAPVTRITLSGTLGQNGWYRSEVGITLTAEDEPDGSGLDVVQYSFDGEVWNRYTGPFAVCSEGSTVLYYRAIDKAGNVEEENGSPKSASFKMDKTPPTITSQRNPGPNTAGWNNSNVTVSFTAEDALSGLASVTPTVIVSREAAGQAVTGIAVDRAGNQATLTVSDISIDKTPPVLIGAPLAAPNAFGWFNGDVTVHWTASDNLSGFDPADVPPDTVLTLEGVGLSVGPVTLTDRAGNAVTASVTGINIDKTPPTLSFGACSPAANAAGWHRSAVSIPFEASDALSGLDPANPASPVLLEEEGMAVSRTVTIADRAGNRISLDTPALRIDWTPPDLAVWATTPAGDYAAGSWTNQDVTVHFGAIDGLSGLLSVPSDTLVTSEGSGQTVVGVAVDQAGNSTTASFSPINIDKTPPRLSAERSPDPNAAGWNNTDVTITFTAADDLSGLASVPAPATVTQEGANMAVVGTATDLAGNSSSLLVEGINIDKTPPRLVASRSPEANMLGWNNTDVTVTFAAGDDLSGLASTTAPVTLPNEGLGQTVTGVATDWAGNETTVTIGDINIDKTPPAVTGAPLTAPNEAGWYAGDVVVRWQVSDALAGVEPAAVPVDTVVTGEGAALSAGPVSVLDRAGNVGTGLTEGIAIDRTPPAIAIAVPQPGQVLPSGTALQFATVDGLSGVGSSVGYLSNRKTTIEVTSGYRPAQGAYDLTVVAVDRAGNRATESRSFSVLPPQTTRIVGTGWFEIGSGQRGRPLANKVAFSFTCHYRQGDPAPTSRWPFMLLADNLRFRSTQYTWLAVDDHAAHFGGRGIVNGSGEYGFLVSVEEGTRGDQDRIRVKIWRLADGTVVLDSQPGADDLAAPATPLRGGRIDIRG